MKDYLTNEIEKYYRERENCEGYEDDQDASCYKKICGKYIVIAVCIFMLLWFSLSLYLYKQKAISNSNDATIEIDIQDANKKTLTTFMTVKQEGDTVHLSYEEPLLFSDMSLELNNLSPEVKYIFDYVTIDKQTGDSINASMNIVPDENGNAILEIHKDDQGVETVKQTLGGM